MKLDTAMVEKHVDRHLSALREDLHNAASTGQLGLDQAAAFMRAAYAKGYTDGLADEDPPPFAAEAERLLRSRASLTGSRARRR